MNLKKITFLILFLHISAVFGQTINQKLLATIPSQYGNAEAYSFKYDANTGSWIYVIYDPASSSNMFLTSKGVSEKIAYGFSYNALFDKHGNSYSYGYDVIMDTLFEYKLFKNNEVIMKFESIADGWNIKDDKIYFAAKEGGKWYLFTLDTKEQTVSKGKAYDEIIFINIPNLQYEGEPQREIGFTSTGLPYYLASENNEWFIVTGDKENKRYSDISRFEFKLTPQDEFCYIAKKSGKFYEDKGNTIAVKGNEEYKAFDWIYSPLLLDNAGNLYYIGQDSLKDYTNRSALMKGNEEIVSVEGSIYGVNFTPQGKLTYIISQETVNKKGESNWINYVVIDNKKYKPFNSVYSPVYNNKGDVLYIASDKNYKSYVVLNDDLISDKFDYINQADFLPDGGIGYVAMNYGNYDKGIPDKNFVFINDKKFGPYDYVTVNNWQIGKMILTDKDGNYAFTAGKLVDKENYYFKYRIISNKGKSKEYDMISETQLINGKLVYFGGNLINKENYTYEYNFFADNIKIGDAFSGYSDYNVNENGIITFLASKGSNIYFIEIKP
jgi:hypothetical protein